MLDQPTPIVWLVAGVIFLAPVALGISRGAFAPAVLAAVLSGLGIATAAMGLTMVAVPGYERFTSAAALAFPIIGSALWLGAMIAGLAGYAAGPSWRR